jgi:galactokinase
MRSLDLEGVVDIDASGTPDAAAIEPRWGRTVAAVLHVLHELGRPPVGFDALVASNLPIGAGLSSSAAFEVAIVLGACRAAGFELPATELALAAQRAEHLATGVACGIQDQLTSLRGVADHALLLDCRTLEVAALPLPASLGIVIVHSGVPRTLDATPWPQRRAESEAVAARLGLRVLRDATPEQVADDPRGRHVVSEIARVHDFADALRRGDVDALGALMLAAHRSSRDDMEVSTPDLDALVDSLVAAGALGARLTGGGFGGCVVALAPAGDAARIARAACDRYRSERGREPAAWVTRAAAGAGRAGE